MSDSDLTTRLLGTAGEDAGCEGTLARLAEYVEGEFSGREMAELLPPVAEHLRNCPACAEDYRGLVELVRRRNSSVADPVAGVQVPFLPELDPEIAAPVGDGRCIDTAYRASPERPRNEARTGPIRRAACLACDGKSEPLRRPGS